MHGTLKLHVQGWLLKVAETHGQLGPDRTRNGVRAPQSQHPHDSPGICTDYSDFFKKIYRVPSPSIPLKGHRQSLKKVFPIDPCVRANGHKAIPRMSLSRTASPVDPSSPCERHRHERDPAPPPDGPTPDRPPLPQSVHQWPDRACPMADPITGLRRLGHGTTGSAFWNHSQVSARGAFGDSSGVKCENGYF